ncbi:hypothetical protein SDC9_150706 [bioreactor metagenome]|uniref:Uncharacterized protein n=1 Tax=bioreactor metagenome TaxID=1076179 RepID=A0A645EPV5_9ZZZZ
MHPRKPHAGHLRDDGVRSRGDEQPVICIRKGLSSIGPFYQHLPRLRTDLQHLAAGEGPDAGCLKLLLGALKQPLPGHLIPRQIVRQSAGRVGQIAALFVNRDFTVGPQALELGRRRHARRVPADDDNFHAALPSSA